MISKYTRPRKAIVPLFQRLLILLLLTLYYSHTVRGQFYDYQAFNGNIYELLSHEGDNVVLFTPEEETALFDSTVINELVGICDDLYSFYRSRLGFDPAGGNPDFNLKTGIAFVPETCGGGCGLIGAKGIEIGHPFYEPILRQVAENNSSSEIDIIAYEFGRNFFTFSSKMLFPGPYGPNDQNGGFAEGFANLMALKALETAYPNANRFLSETAYYTNELYRLGLAYVNNPAATPDSVLAKNGIIVDKNRNKRGLHNPAGFPASGILFLLDSLFANEGFYPDFFTELAQRPDVTSMQDGLHNIFIATCKSVGANLTSFFQQALKFTLSDAALLEIMDLPHFETHRLLRDLEQLVFTTFEDSVSFVVNSVRPLQAGEAYTLSYLDEGTWVKVSESVDGKFIVTTSDLPFLRFDTMMIRGAVESQGQVLDEIQTKIYYQATKAFLFGDESTNEGYVNSVQGNAKIDELPNGFLLTGLGDSSWNGVLIELPYGIEQDHTYSFECMVRANPVFVENNGEVLFENVFPTNGIFNIQFGSREIIHGGLRFGIDENMTEGWNVYAFDFDSRILTPEINPVEIPWKISLIAQGWQQYELELQDLVVTDVTLTNEIQDRIDGTTSAKESTRNPIILYPNPLMSQSGKINFSNGVPASLAIFDIQGREILNYTLSFGDTEITLPAIEPGIYVVRLSERNGTQDYFKLVVN